MALEKQLIPVVFEKGLNQDPDEKVLPLGELTQLEDGFWVKRGTIRTRNGFNSLTTGTIDGGTNGGGRACYNRDRETVIMGGTDNDTFQSFSEADGSWAEMGKNVSRQMTEDVIMKNNHGQAYHDSAAYENYEVYAWMDTRDGGVRCSVYDSEAKTFLIKDRLISAVHDNQYPEHVRVALCDDSIFIVWSEVDSGSGSVKSARWDSSDPDTLTATAVINPNLETSNQEFAFDICEYDSGAIAYTYYRNTSHLRVGFLLKSGVVGNGSNGYPSEVSATTVCGALFGSHNSLRITAQASDGSVFLVYYSTAHALSVDGYYYCGLESDLTLKLTETAIETWQEGAGLPTNPYGGRIGLVWTASDTMEVYYEIESPDPNGLFNEGAIPGEYAEQSVSIRNVSAKDDGTVGTPEWFMFHSQIATDPFFYDSVKYLPVVFTGFHSEEEEFASFQQTGFVVNEDHQIVSKYDPGRAGIEVARESGWHTLCHQSPHLMDLGSGKYAWAALKNSNSAVWPTSGKSPGVVDPVGYYYPHDGVGIVRKEIDVSDVSIQDGTEVRNVLFLGDGVIKQYDGKNFSEVGFNVYPDRLAECSVAFSIEVTQQGDGGQPEISDVTCIPGGMIRPGNQFTLYDASDNPIEFKYGVDGVNPSIGSGEFLIDIDSYDSMDEVAEKTQTVINLRAEFTATVSKEVVTVTNAANGAATDGEEDDMNTGFLSDGTRSYKAIYVWTDNQGNVQRSAPSPALQVTLSAGGAVTDQKTVIAVPSLRLTDKQDTNATAVVELYRTEDNGTIYYKVDNYRATFGPEILQRENDWDNPWTHVFDLTPDADLIDNRILYTTGGIIENIGPDMASAMTSNKDRIFYSPENSNAIYYSKKFVDQIGVEFSDILKKDMSSFGGYISAYAALDDKVVIFKPKATFWMSGDGPNVLGVGSFTEPQLLSRDIGCVEPLSIQNIPDGVIFKSNKGWYLLSRSLQLSYIGSQIENSNSLEVTGSIVKPNSHQVFWSSSSDLLMYDYHYRQWSVWKNLSAVGLCYLRQGDTDSFALLKGSGSEDGQLWYDNTVDDDDDNIDPDGNWASLVVRTGWFQMSAISGFQRARRIQFVGYFLEGQIFKIKIYRDYDESNYDEVDYIPTSDVDKFQINLPVQKCSAMMIKIEQEQNDNVYYQAELTGMTIEIGAKRGTDKLQLNRKYGGTQSFPA